MHVVPMHGVHSISMPSAPRLCPRESEYHPQNAATHEFNKVKALVPNFVRALLEVAIEMSGDALTPSPQPPTIQRSRLVLPVKCGKADYRR
jgi:hypothetical protein